MKIRITKGTYRLADGGGKAALKSRGDVVDVPEAEAKRLVNPPIAIAEYVDDDGPNGMEILYGKERAEEMLPAMNALAEASAPAEPDAAKTQQEGEDVDEMQQDGELADADDISTMPFKDLQAMAKNMGLAAGGSKQELIDRIEAAGEVTMTAKEAV